MLKLTARTVAARIAAKSFSASSTAMPLPWRVVLWLVNKGFLHPGKATQWPRQFLPRQCPLHLVQGANYSQYRHFAVAAFWKNGVSTNDPASRNLRSALESVPHRLRRFFRRCCERSSKCPKRVTSVCFYTSTRAGSSASACSRESCKDAS